MHAMRFIEKYLGKGFNLGYCWNGVTYPTPPFLGVGKFDEVCPPSITYFSNGAQRGSRTFHQDKEAQKGNPC